MCTTWLRNINAAAWLTSLLITHPAIMSSSVSLVTRLLRAMYVYMLVSYITRVTHCQTYKRTSFRCSFWKPGHRRSRRFYSSQG
ncbi:hypothetical protein GGR57DRAFT_462814 [Xylariaceae sp. FL1272]|nr:hypothetical protein GGR57DRAFT_462814 [Xylariaceae sp. FL1272]